MAHNVKRMMSQKGEEVNTLSSDVEAFGRKLFFELERRGWSQSDLARKLFPNSDVKYDNRGYTVTKGRDVVSSWVRGKALPSPQNLIKVAAALGMDPEVLAPDITTSTIEKENPTLSINMIAGHVDKCYLRVNRLVPLSVALEIAKLLEGVEKK
jgi:transcriptional regulator with XRE-family HTH domain